MLQELEDGVIYFHYGHESVYNMLAQDEDRREHGTDHALPAHDERAPDQPLQQTVYTNNAAIRTAALRSSRSLDLRG